MEIRRHRLVLRREQDHSSVRQYNPNAKAGSHNYTTSKKENDYLIAHGWREEGIGWYGKQ